MIIRLDPQTKHVVKQNASGTSGGTSQLTPASLDIVKGYTKASVIAFVLMTLSEYNPRSTDEWQKISPFVQFLDKSWLLPMHAPLLHQKNN